VSSKKQIREAKRVDTRGRRRAPKRTSGPTFQGPDGQAWTLVAGDPATGKGIVLFETFGSAQGPRNKRPAPAVFKRDYSPIGRGAVGGRA
jgi:hypothetical protein